MNHALPTIHYDKVSLKGIRPTNEDMEVCHINLHAFGHAINPNYAPINLFIICDGHGGSLVSRYVVKELKNEFIKKDLAYPLSHQKIFKIFDSIQSKLIYHPAHIARACGSTALVLIIYSFNDKRYLQVINLGDCRAVLCRKGLAIPLTIDHKPSWTTEKLRISKINEKYGTKNEIHFDGSDWRIGDLSVSRSFGDLDNTPYVTHKPDIWEYSLSYKDDFIVVACDGVWDVLQNHEVVNFVSDHIQNNQTDCYKIQYKYYPQNDGKNIAMKLGNYVLARGSTDNVSIIIIYL